MARPQNLQKSLPVLVRLVRHFWPKLRQHRGLAAASLGVLVAEVFLRLLEPWPLSFLVDRVISPGVAVDALDPTALIVVAAVAVVAFAALRALSRYLSAVGFALIGNRVLTEVRDELYRHLQSLSLSFHAKSRGGDLVVRVIGDVGLLREVVVTALLPLLGNLLILLGMLSVMFWMHWQLALAAVSTAPLFWLSTTRLGRRIRAISHKQRRTEGHMASTAAEALAAIETVQALSLDETFSESFQGQSQQDLKEGVQGKRMSARLERTTDVLNALAQALVLGFGAHIVLRGELTVGQLLVFLAYLRSGFRPVRNFAKYSARIAKASAAGDRVLEVLEREPDVRDLPGAVTAPRFAGALRFEDVQFAYEPGHPVLKGVDFEIQPGQRVALVGSSGSGKSTLVSLCLRLHDPDTGRVLIDGRDVREFSLTSLRPQIGVVLQDTLLFAASIRDNIAVVAPDASVESVEAAARDVGADAFIRALPDGYDTIVGERGVTLSRGQRQRIAIARAAMRRPSILILDEPMSGLDEENEQLVKKSLERVALSSSVLLVTHELRHAAECDRILLLENGTIVERGDHAELMKLGGRYATLYRMQASDSAGSRNGHRALAR